MKILTILPAVLALTASTLASDWPQWRGPNFNGATEAKGLPTSFSKTERVLWSVDMPGPAASTPVILGDKVFVSTTDQTARTLHALCIDRKSGQVLWNKKVGEGYQRDDRSNFASPSPVADKDRVFFFYGTGLLVAMDHAGTELWTRNITQDYGEFAFLWTFSTSPMLSDGTLYLQVLQRDSPVQGRGRTNGPIESYILGINPANGETQWRVVRPGEAVAESLEAFTTPIPFEHAGRKEILVAGGDVLTGHDPKTGAELWRWGTWNPTQIGHWRLVPSPVGGRSTVLVCAPKGDPVYAIQAGGRGRLSKDAVVWKSDQAREVHSDVPTPLFYKNDYFVLSDARPAKHLSRVDEKTGAVKWSVELGRVKFEASPTGADGKIYAINFAGDVMVVDAEKGELLNTIKMGEEGDNYTRSTIAVAHNQLFVRTNQKLFCIGNK